MPANTDRSHPMRTASPMIAALHGTRQATSSDGVDSMTGSEKTLQINLRTGGGVATSADGPDCVKTPFCDMM